MKRVLCVWLPDFPIQRLHAELPETKSAAAVLYAESGNRAQVVMASSEARRYGIRAGMSLAEAQALHDEATFLPHDADADARALLTLAEVAGRCSPLVGLEQANGEHCLLLDISGCEHLFGDESGLARQLVIDLAEHGYFAHVAVAGTIGAAWAIARYGHGTGADRRLKSLPVAALRIPESLAAKLREFDLRTIGQVSALPRESLPSRFGSVLLERLDQLYGCRVELLTPVPQPEPIIAEWASDEPICHRNAIGYVCSDLLGEILDVLTAQRRGLLGLTLTLIGEAAEPDVLDVRLAQPNDSQPHLLKLIELKLETQPLPDWLHTVRLEASATAPLQIRQRGLFAQPEPDADEASVRRLLDRLSARLGTDSVARPYLLPEAVPEQAAGFQSTTDRASSAQTGTGPSFASARPLVLLSPPEPVRVTVAVSDGPPVSFQWDRRIHRVACCTNLERIATAWWQDTGSVQRDYWRVETTSGARFWLFRDRRGDWFLHGLFD
jgi:protein ImuB